MLVVPLTMTKFAFSWEIKKLEGFKLKVITS